MRNLAKVPRIRTMQAFTTKGNAYGADNGRSKAIWMTGEYECYIFGDLTVEELKQMINSIGQK